MNIGERDENRILLSAVFNPQSPRGDEIKLNRINLCNLELYCIFLDLLDFFYVLFSELFKRFVFGSFLHCYCLNKTDVIYYYCKCYVEIT